MKRIIKLLLLAVAVTPAASESAQYTLNGERYLRKYTAEYSTPAANAEMDAALIVDRMCNVPWEISKVKSATVATHTPEILNDNVKNRDSLDAAIFCAGHSNSMHVAYANAACYRIDLKASSTDLPRLQALSLNVYSDAYNKNGVRIVVITNDSGEIPTECSTVRGDAPGGIKVTNSCARITRTTGGKEYWYPSSATVTFGADELGSTGIQLHRYLLVFVLMENYASVRGDWLEGSSFIANKIKITTSSALPSALDGCDIAEPYATTYHLKDGRAGDDDDGDGLSNYAEYLATEVFRFANISPDNPMSNGTTPDFFIKVGDCYLGEIFTSRESEVESEVKNVMAKVVYNGPQDIDSITIEAWKDYKKSKPDAIWHLRKSDAISSDFNSMTFNLVKPSKGYLRKGGNTFIVYSGDDYTAGAPYGFVRDVNVGWNAAAFELEVTDTNPVFARLNLADGSNDRTVIFGSDSGNVETNDGVVASMLSGGRRNHIRVVPYSLSCWAFEQNHTSDPFEPCLKYGMDYRVVAEFDLDSETHPYITEADFIRDGAYDIDWNGFGTTAFAKHPALEAAGVSDITAVRYRIVIGADGPLGKDSPTDSKTVERVYSTLIERRFESTNSRTLPSALTLEGGSVLYGGNPTFIWRLDEPTQVDDNMVRGSAYFGCSYTAFQIEVADAKTGEVVYDSGVRRAPVKDANGRFVWTAPLAAGSQTALAKVFARAGNWKWRVAMYNAKFRPSDFANGWSTYSNFSTAVGQQQESDDHGFGSVKLAIKYAGPEKVLGTCDKLSSTKGIVRVQAFTTPDFSGYPVAETFLTNKTAMTTLTDIGSNIALDGLKTGATYYVRAYVDSNGNLEKDAWESWGGAKAGVEIVSGKAIETVAIWNEDADTDGDWLPEAWEYLTRGYTVGVSDGEIDPNGGIILETTTYNDIVAGKANISKTLSGSSLTMLMNPRDAPLLLGYGQNVTTNTISNIRSIINNNITEQ